MPAQYRFGKSLAQMRSPDLGHRHFRNCVLCLPFFESAWGETELHARNLFGVNGDANRPFDSTPGPSRFLKDGRTVYSTNGSPTAFDTAHYAALNSNEVTVFAWFQWNGATTTWLVVKDKNDGTNRDYALAVASDGDPSFYVFTDGATSFGWAIPTNVPITANVPVCVAGRYFDGSTQVWVNGVLIDTSVATGNLAQHDTGIEVNQRGASGQTAGDVYMVRVYNRALPVRQLQEISRDPWAPWRRHQPYWLRSEGSAATPSVPAALYPRRQFLRNVGKGMG